jgi:hypothetical protein
MAAVIAHVRLQNFFCSSPLSEKEDRHEKEAVAETKEACLPIRLDEGDRGDSGGRLDERTEVSVRADH